MPDTAQLVLEFMIFQVIINVILIIFAQEAFIRAGVNYVGESFMCIINFNIRIQKRNDSFIVVNIPVKNYFAEGSTL